MDLQKTGSLIAEARKQKGMTQEQLAKALHLSHTTVSKWERGLGFPDVSLLEPLGEVLGLSLTELFRGEIGVQTPDTEAVAEQAVSAAHRELRRIKRQTHIVLAVTGAILLGAVLYIVGNTFWQRYVAPYDLDIRGSYQNTHIPVGDYGGQWEGGVCIQLAAQNWREEQDFWLYVNSGLVDQGTWIKQKDNLYLLEGAFGSYTVELHRDGSFYLELPGAGIYITMEKIFDIPVVPGEAGYGEKAEEYRRQLFGQ